MESSLIAYCFPEFNEVLYLRGSSPSKSGVRFDDSLIAIHYKPSGKDFVPSFRFGGNTFQDELIFSSLLIIVRASTSHFFKCKLILIF